MTGFKLEPVGWMYSYIGGTEVQTSKERWTGRDWKSYWEETPLYTTPQPEEHQPLTCQECGGDGAGGEHEEDCAMAQTEPDVSSLEEGGLPPVGVECEIRYLGKYNNNWMPFRATAITSDFVVGYIRNDRESAVNHKDPYVEFRPLKSKQETKHDSQ